MRQITDHIVDGDSVNHQLIITVADEPGAGGANHDYLVTLPSDGPTTGIVAHIRFQNGPINEVGVNGITNEALIAIAVDRLRGFQAGPFANDHNELALMAGQSMLFHLQTRTRERIKRGVEGTHQK